MNCELVTENLTAYLDRELSGRETQDVRSHVEACAGCRRELDELRAAMLFIHERVKELEPRPVLWRNVHARITALPAPSPAAGLFELFRTRWAPAALAVSIALGLGVWGYVEHQEGARQTAARYAIERYMDSYVRLRDGEERLHRVPARPVGRLLVLHEEFSDNPFVNVAEQSPPNPFVIDQGRSEGTR